MAAICHRLAKFSSQSGKKADAEKALEDAVKHDETCVGALLDLAKLRLENEQYDAAQHQCMLLMRIESGNEEASMIMADIMFRKAEYDAAIYHYQQILDNHPTNYEVLSQLVRLLRR